MRLNMGHDNMSKLSTLLQACANVAQIIGKNQYYKNTDFNRAFKIAYNYYMGVKKVELLKQGNLKLEKNVLIFDLPSIITCKCACADCYSIKAERIYKNTRIMRLYHLLLIECALYDNNFKAELLKDFKRQIEKSAKKQLDMQIVRWHGSGDFYKKEYLQLFLELTQACINIKNCKFYTYTKQLTNGEIDFINNTYNNLNIVKSMIAGRFINYGNEEYLKKVIDYLKEHGMPYYICDYGAENAHTCMGSCKICLYCSNVLFHKH